MFVLLNKYIYMKKKKKERKESFERFIVMFEFVPIYQQVFEFFVSIHHNILFPP